ncbi:MAG: cell division protein FtsB [Spiribacter salinus]|jgi:cell division protein FtsB|uniref:Cell division protein FtsB n=1 Tax=Spiribacter salinus TaxID=1335746 RepID=A0A540VUC0_9GAMM|nr:MAG: cell division protein FtsB [Spiribacter salinus]
MRIVAALLLLVLFLLQSRLWLGDGSIPEVWRLQQAVKEQASQNEALDERNRALAADVADLRQGQEAIEERARRELGMVGADEQFYLVIEPDER